MKEILSARKNRGNVTFRITLSEDSDRVLMFIEKLMKVRSSEPGKKTTKKVVYEHSFTLSELEAMQTVIADEEMYSFCLETLENFKK